MKMKIGILALQGDVKEHSEMLRKCNVEPVLVKLPSDLDGINGLIIPGGESTAIGLLMRKSGLDKILRDKIESGLCVYGTCAGAIILAKEIIGENPRLGVIDVSVKRNDYGRQIESFEVDVDVKGFDKKFHAVFIRAPVIETAGKDVEVLAEFEKKPILARERNVLVSTFHPEVTNDKRIHEMFIGMVK